MKIAFNCYKGEEGKGTNMKEGFKIVQLKKEQGKRYDISFLGKENAEKVQQFHASFPVYEKTPLVSFMDTAAALGIKAMYVKDESYRFGLNAFKVLGGSYAIGSYLAQKLGMDISQLPYDKMISDEVRKKLGEITFVTATDGNHGRGVAWTANQLKQKAVVYMPKGSAKERLKNIQAEGAEASITDLNYDSAVRLANSQAEEKGWVMVQDTAWEGYEDIPAWIMQGYGTMGYEAAEQLPERPTHIFLQAGLGSMAGASCPIVRSRVSTSGKNPGEKSPRTIRRPVCSSMDTTAPSRSRKSSISGTVHPHPRMHSASARRTASSFIPSGGVNP